MFVLNFNKLILLSRWIPSKPKFVLEFNKLILISPLISNKLVEPIVPTDDLF